MQIYCAFSMSSLLWNNSVVILNTYCCDHASAWFDLNPAKTCLSGQRKTFCKSLILLDDSVLLPFTCLCCPWAILCVLTRVVCHSALNWECFLNSNSVPDFALVCIPHYMSTFIFSICSYRCCCSTNFVISLLFFAFSGIHAPGFGLFDICSTLCPEI